MGSVGEQIENHFRLGGPRKSSTLNFEQKLVNQALSERLLSDLGGAGEFDTSGILERLLGAGTQEGQALAERMFSEALMGPAMRAFDTQVRPRVNSSFAGIGGTLSSRRGNVLGQALTDVTTSATGQLAGMLPTILNFPIQQSLAQISGLGGLDQLRAAPISRAMPFALQGTQVFPQVPMGPGMEVLREYGMSTASTAGGLQFGGLMGLFG